MAIGRVRNEQSESSPQTVLAKLESTWQIYNMQQVNLESGVTKDNLLQRTADMLTFYRMDEKFYSNPENLFFALAFQQELMLAQDDPRPYFKTHLRQIMMQASWKNALKMCA